MRTLQHARPPAGKLTIRVADQLDQAFYPCRPRAVLRSVHEIEPAAATGHDDRLGPGCIDLPHLQLERLLPQRRGSSIRHAKLKKR